MSPTTVLSFFRPKPKVIPGAITRIVMGNTEMTIYPIGYDIMRGQKP